MFSQDALTLNPKTLACPLLQDACIYILTLATCLPLQDVCVSRLPGEASAASFSIRHPGALAFEAPEVLSGLSSGQSDVYSFGCVLFCMSTGRQNPLSHDPLDLQDPGLDQGQDGAGGVTLQPDAGGVLLLPDSGGGVMLQPDAGGDALQPGAGGLTLQWPGSSYPPLRQLLCCVVSCCVVLC